MFEELDYRETPLGPISLRRRSEPRLNGKVLYEVKLGEEFLMSSLFVEAEEQLATLALQSLDTQKLDVVVGGLGLGYTAAKALDNQAVRSLLVIEVMAPVISWHQLGLVPLGDKLTLDSRCSLMHEDFFKLAAASGSFDRMIRAVCFTPCCSILTILLATGWTRGIARSTPTQDLLRWRPRCIPAGSLDCGPMIHQMTRLPGC